MKHAQTTLPADGQPKKSAMLTPAARGNWTTSFTTQATKDAPSSRLKARAELVRSALSSTQY